MCIFCRIVRKEIPCYCIYEDDDVMAFLDISQVTKGHTLVIPKKHYDNLLECDDEVLAHVAQAARKVGNHIMEITQAEGMNILSNVHELAGQSVEHFHIHLIPRYSVNDSFVVEFNSSDEQDKEKLAQLLKVS